MAPEKIRVVVEKTGDLYFVTSPDHRGMFVVERDFDAIGNKVRKTLCALWTVEAQIRSENADLEIVEEK